MTDLSKLLELDNGWLMPHRSEYLAWMQEVVTLMLSCPPKSRVRAVRLVTRSNYWAAGFSVDECFKDLCTKAYGGELS